MAVATFTLAKVLEQINTLNSLSLASTELTFSSVRPNDETWQGESLAGNTLIRITPNETSDYTGTVICGYDRLPLSVLHTIMGGKIRLPSEVTNAEGAVPYFESVYGFALQPGDLTGGDVVTDGEGKKTLTFTAADTAVAFVGSATFDIIESAVPIANIFTSTTLDGYKYINDSTKGFAESYSYPYDFTAQFDVLSTITTQTTNMTALAAALSAITGDSWVATGAAGFSLDGAVIAVAGINDPLWGTNNNYKYAIIVTLTAACANLEGQLIIHFNDPVEAFDPSQV